jgi:hypothetical protein
LDSILVTLIKERLLMRVTLGAYINQHRGTRTPVISHAPAPRL